MGDPTRSRRTVALLAALAALVVPAAAHAADPPKAEIATSGNDSELLQKVPISKQPGARDRVAMRLGPDQLKPIQVGDRLRASAEVQVSTTCVEKGPRCIGRSYDVEPDDQRQDRALAEPRGGAALPAAVRDQERALQAAAPEPQPPLHDRDPEHRDGRQRSQRAAVPARRLLRGPDRRRHVEEVEEGRRRRARRRPPRPHGPAGQGPAERRSSAVEGAGADGELERGARQHPAPADGGQAREAPGRLLGADPRAPEGRDPRLRRQLRLRYLRTAVQHLHRLAGADGHSTRPPRRRRASRRPRSRCVARPPSRTASTAPWARAGSRTRARPSRRAQRASRATSSTRPPACRRPCI